MWRLDHLRQDVWYAMRLLWRSPAFTALAVLSLALGIGATTAVVVVLDAVALRPLPVIQPDRLVVVRAMKRGERFPIFNPVFEELRRRQQVFTAMAAVSDQPFLPVSVDGAAPAYVTGSLVSGNYFEVLGVPPALGRSLVGQDDVPGADCVAVISHGWWVRDLGQRPTVVGTHIRVRETLCTIVGVAPLTFTSHQAGFAPDVWLPLRVMTSREMLDNHRLAFFSGVIARLRDSITPEAAERDLADRYRQIVASESLLVDRPGTPHVPASAFGIRLLPGAQGLGALRDEYERSLWIVFGVVIVFLLIATLNICLLLIARGAMRTTELATRAALGAGRARLLRQLATEGTLVAFAGGVLGVALASVVTPFLASSISVPYFTVVLETATSVRSAIAIAGLIATAAVIAGMLPAWRLSGIAIHPAVAGAGRATTRGGQLLARRLVILQLALALLLVSVAGLLMQTLANLHATDPGFRPDGVLVLEVQHERARANSQAGMPEPDQRAALVAEYEALERELSAIAGVRSAALSWLELFGGSDLGLNAHREDRPDVHRNAHTDLVTAGYFDTVGMQITAGRGFTAQDRSGALPVAVVNQTLARAWFPDGSPIGKAITLEFARYQQPPFTIVGVVRDSKYNGLRESTVEPMVWVPLPQWPFEIQAITLRVHGGMEAEVERDVRSRMAVIDATLMVRKVTTLRDQVDQTMAREQLLLNLAAITGALALLLAAVGLYGTLAYSVAQRTREFGIRMVVGADRQRVLRLIMREAAIVAMIGIALGLPLAMAAGYASRAFLFGVPPVDVMTLAGACAVLVGVVAVAGYLPARHASSIEPIVALRQD